MPRANFGADRRTADGARCVDGALLPTQVANLTWFHDQRNQTKAKRIYEDFAFELGNISRAIDLRNAVDYDKNFNAFNPKHLELSVSL